MHTWKPRRATERKKCVAILNYKLWDLPGVGLRPISFFSGQTTAGSALLFSWHPAVAALAVVCHSKLLAFGNLKGLSTLRIRAEGYRSLRDGPAQWTPRSSLHRLPSVLAVHNPPPTSPGASRVFHLSMKTKKLSHCNVKQKP